MIYYVEDDNNIRDLVIYTLGQAGFDAMGFEDASAFFVACKEQRPELVLLDIMLPNEDGITILKRLKADSNTADLPVIMVTAKGTEYDKVIGLDTGADDYITKPFGMIELVARIKALLRRTVPKPSTKALSYGELTLDVRKHIVTVQAKPVTLTFKEFELLHFWMENNGTAFSREHLLTTVWDYGYDGGTRTVDVHVQTLRQKLGDCGTMIETVRGIGYRFGG
jgi:two-component system alkaline phosphatase synthesis response regulator PhoP